MSQGVVFYVGISYHFHSWPCQICHDCHIFIIFHIVNLSHKKCNSQGGNQNGVKTEIRLVFSFKCFLATANLREKFEIFTKKTSNKRIYGVEISRKISIAATC